MSCDFIAKALTSPKYMYFANPKKIMEEGSSTPHSNKRSRSEVEEEEVKQGGGSTALAEQNDGNHDISIVAERRYANSVTDTSSDDDIGPQLPSSAPKKKRRVLPY